MGLIKQRVGRHQHKMGAVDEIGNFGCPYMRCFKKSPGYDLKNNKDRKRNNKPHKNPPRPFAYLIHSIQECLDLHLHSFPFILIYRELIGGYSGLPCVFP
jgi:hypothetical protein